MSFHRRRSHSFLLALVALLDAVQARIITVHTSNNEACYDRFDNVVPCPKKPMDKTKVIIIVVTLSVLVLAVIGGFLFCVMRRRTRYQQLAAPPLAVMGQQGAIMTPAPPGEMGYAGPQPQLPYAAPQVPYNAPAYTPHPPQDVKYMPGPLPTSTAYVPPQGPPPPPPPPPPTQGAAATYYGYSAGPI